MDEYKLPFSSDLSATLAGANEALLPFSAITKDMNDKMQSTLKTLQFYQQHFPPIYDTFDQVELSINNIYASLLEYQSPLLEATKVTANWPKFVIESDALKQIRDVSEMWKANFDTILNPLGKTDFRIGVLSQELEQLITDTPEEVAEKLLFKDIPEPTNETESQFFQILYKFRPVPVHSSEISRKTHDSQSENIPNKEIENSHKTPAFYEDKMCYAEVACSTVLGLIIERIYSLTTGTDPGNTIGFVLLFSCLVSFINPNKD